MNFNAAALSDGLTVLVIGVFAVLLFICVLIFAMNVTARIINYLNGLFPAPQAAPAFGNKAKTEETEEIAVAIASALLLK